MKIANFPSVIYNRDNYLKRIKPFINKAIIKVLTGQRRVGKSYILFQLIQKITEIDPDSNIIYINKEDLSFDFIKNAEDLNQYVISNSSQQVKNYIFIDEIQEIVNFEKSIRSLLLDENNDIYITGSNANMLSGELATFLSGRYVEFEIKSLAYPEFLKFHKLENTDESLRSYYYFGGLPYLINLTLNNQATEYLKGIYTTIVYRDVVSRYKVRNTVLLEKLIAFLADNIGNLFSAKRISDFLKSQNTMSSANQIQQYVDYLASSFLIHRVGRYDVRGRKIFEIGEKFYFENIGIRNLLVGFNPADLGKVLENLVYNHLLYLGWNIRIGVFDTNEIDFVANMNGETIYLQVALRLDEAKTIEREFGNLLKIKDNYPKYVITNDPFYGNSYQGVKHIYIRDFLMLEKIG